MNPPLQLDSTISPPKLEVRLEHTIVAMRFGCLVCRGTSEKETVNADVFINGAPSGLVVCEECLRLSPDKKVASLRNKAASRRSEAKFLDEVAASLPPMPTHEAWLRANMEAEKEYVASLGAAYTEVLEELEEARSVGYRRPEPEPGP